MLYVVFDSGRERTWHVGEPLPVKETEIDAVSKIQADGDELEFIKELFFVRNTMTIPMPYNKRSVLWYGDIAKTILVNL